MRLFRCDIQYLAHLFAYAQACPMEANPDRPRLLVENLRDLFGLQFLHVVEHKNNAQLDGDLQDRLMQ